MEHVLHMAQDLGRIDGLMEKAVALVAGSLSEERLSSFEIAVTEALTNAVRHAAAPDPDIPIRVSIRILPAEVRLEIVDAGRRAPDDLYRDVPDPDQLDAMSESGRGVPLICLLADHVTFQAGEGRNLLQLTFLREDAG